MEDYSYLEHGEFDLLPMKDRLMIICHYYDLNNRGIYRGSDIWERLSVKMNAHSDFEKYPHMSPTLVKEMVSFLLSLGTDLTTHDERFFDDYGIYYEDYRCPSDDDSDENGSDGSSDFDCDDSYDSSWDY